MAQLYAPEIPGKIPAQWGTTFQCNYTPSRANPTGTMAIKIKNLVTDRVYTEEIHKNAAYVDLNTKQPYVKFEGLNTSDLIIGQYYKVQIAHVENTSQPLTSNIGTYSTVGIFKYTDVSEASLRWDESSETLLGEYINKDLSELLEWYRIDVYKDEKLISSSGQIYNRGNLQPDHDTKSTCFSFTPTLLESGDYKAQCMVVTLNEVVCYTTDIIIKLELSNRWVDEHWSVEHSFEEGIFKFQIETAENKKYYLARCDQDSDFTWTILHEWDGEPNKTFTFLDNSCEQYKNYFYGLQKKGNDIALINSITPLYCDFEDCFLSDDERQLKIRFNPKVSNFKLNLQESKTDTIGGKFPIFFRNGNLGYHEFSINGLISMHMDENNMFTYKESLSKQQRPSTQAADMLDIYFTKGREFYLEREFKKEVYKWLTNGKPKLFRSPTEGNFIVRLMNITLTPEETLGRMLHSFQATAYEIMDCTVENLKKCNFIIKDVTVNNEIIPPTIPDNVISNVIYDGGSVEG